MSEKISTRNHGGVVALLGTAGLALLISANPGVAEEQIRAVAVFPPAVNTSVAFQEFVSLVNERGKGVVQISYVGGPEVIPGNQQIDAVRRNVVDMTYAPASYSMGSMPEADAWVASTVAPSETRENGGFEIMQEVFKERLGVHLLSRLTPAASFHLFLLKEPQRTANGGIDFSGLRIRSSPLFNSFLEDLGAVPVAVPVPDVYTGLERGTFDGVGYPAVSILDLSWDRFLKYRIDPGFYGTDLAIVLNPAKWESLSEEARKIVSQAAVEYEEKSYQDFVDLAAEIDQKFKSSGGQVIALEGEATDEYLDKAYDSAWKRLEESGSPFYEKLRRTHYDR